jgi:hypothetical protein
MVGFAVKVAVGATGVAGVAGAAGNGLVDVAPPLPQAASSSATPIAVIRDKRFTTQLACCAWCLSVR